MSALWDAGVRGASLDVAAAWKDALLLAALALALWRVRRLPVVQAADLLALVYAALVVLYALLPQDWLGGEATARGVLLALRHHLIPVAAYALGRLLALTLREERRVLAVAAGTAAAVAAWGLVDVYLVSLQWWRDSGAPGWYRDQLGLDYEGLSGLPENWVYNTGDEQRPLRRLVSSFLSPLATAYVLVVVLLLLAVGRRAPLRLAAAALCLAGLYWTHTRAAYLALAAGLLVLAAARRRRWPLLAAAGVVALGLAFVEAFPTIGPVTSYTEEELAFLREHAARNPGASADPLSPGESSLSSHLDNLREGVETVLRHPQGYGLGNAGVTAKRTGVAIRAGESTYAELGVETGLAGMLAFLAWSVLLVRALWSRSAWLTAAFVAVLLLGLQTDVIGVTWLAYCVWLAAGVAVTRREAPIRAAQGSPEPAAPGTGAEAQIETTRSSPPTR
jgi:hypothetical protein